MSAAPVEIRTARLMLRELRRTDAAAMRRIVTQPEVGRMLFIFPQGWTDAEAETFIEGCAYRGRLGFRLAIGDGAGRFLGSVGVGEGDEPEVFYFLDPAVAGGGLATEAVGAFAAFLFATFPVRGLVAQVFTDNPASARVLEKLGFLRTGLGTHASAARLEPAPVWLYRLSREGFAAANRKDVT